MAVANLIRFLRINGITDFEITEFRHRLFVTSPENIMKIHTHTDGYIRFWVEPIYKHKYYIKCQKV